ncbi:MAG TPA: aspartate aminotransferase family protein [Planctomycetaceae bacterium]|nr:aspartate aminotransferase family protein [Planctomycetaceae bacterium]
MDTQQFREQAHRLVDWMADYLESVEEYPVRSQVQPGDVTRQLPSSAPLEGESFESIFSDFQSVIMPGMTHWQHPNFFAFFTANSSPPSVLAEMLTATLGAQCMLWETSPAATELETVVLQWLAEMLGLPIDDSTGFRGCIHDTASTAILCAILVAREKATGWDSNAIGLASSRQIAMYTSAETHSSTEKAVKIAGLGEQNLRKIRSDASHSIAIRELESTMQRDQEAGITPACIIASLGATGVGAIDNIEQVGQVCKRFGAQLIVDAAWAGSALILPEYRALLSGIDFVDAIIVNPHKWLLTNFDCSVLYMRDTEALLKTFSILPSYLRHDREREVVDYRDWGIALGRRFRALKLWFVIRSYGVEGLRKILRSHIELAEWLEKEIASHPNFEITSTRCLSLFTFRFTPKTDLPLEELNALNKRLVDRINDGGRAYLTTTLIGEERVIRFNIGQTYTAEQHVQAAWKLIQQTADEVNKT